MTLGTFNLDQTLADLRSDEGVDPAVAILPMPPRWLAVLAPYSPRRIERDGQGRFTVVEAVPDDALQDAGGAPAYEGRSMPVVRAPR